MRISPLAVSLSILSAAAWAQPSNETSESMESCFQSARAADAICSDPANDAVKRLGCLAKARAAQLECLDKVLPNPPAGPAASETLAEPNPPELPTGTIQQQTAPADPAPAVPPKVSSDMRSEAPPPDLPAAPAPMSPEPAVPVDIAPIFSSNWLVSETTSPLDYSPLIIAVTRSTSREEDAPTSFSVRCRRGQADVLVGTQGTWRGSRAGELQVDYQVDEQPPVRQLWTASDDGKAARHPQDALALLRSFSNGARLKVSVSDRPGAAHEATFQLEGLDAVRSKIERACKPISAGDAASAPAHIHRGEYRRAHSDESSDGESRRHRRH